MDDTSFGRARSPLGPFGDRRLVAGAVGALLVAAVGFSSAGSGPAGADGLVWEPGIVRSEAGSLDDGYRHLVVAFEDAAPGPAPGSATPDAGGPAAPSVPIPEHDGVVDDAVLAELSRRGPIRSLERVDGRLVAVLGDPGGGTGTGAPGSTSPGGAERLAALAAVPGTAAVHTISPGSYQVATSAEPAAYAGLPEVLAVYDDVVMEIHTDDTHYASQWHLQNTGQTLGGQVGISGVDVGAESAWAVTEGAGQVVAVVDTGMEITHPDLADRIWTNPDETCGNGIDDDGNGYVDDCRGWDFANNDASVNDTGIGIDNRHATHIAGTIAAVTGNSVGVAGVAPRAKVMPVKASNSGSFWMSDVARGINYAVTEGADVINLSLGTNPGVPIDQLADVRAAVQYAASRGVLVVASAGNSSLNTDVSPTYPASLPDANVISVGASDNRGQPASFSNRGATTVDLHAPGVSILATLPGATYGGMNGTSMAAPQVAAAVALIEAARPDLTPAGVKEQLLFASTPEPALAGLSVSGARLDVGRILNPFDAGLDGPVSFSFDGFGGAVAGEPSSGAARATVTPSAVPAGAHVAYRATLFTTEADAIYGVVGAPVTTAEGPAVTDENASIALSPPDGYPPADATRDLSFGFTLPAGRYALAAEAYTPADGVPLGRPWVVFFDVAGLDPPAGAPPPEPSTTTTTQPNPWTSPPPTWAPAPTTPTTNPTWPVWPTPTTAPAGPAPTTPNTQPPPTRPPATQPQATQPPATQPQPTQPAGTPTTTRPPSTPLTTVRPSLPPPTVAPAPTTTTALVPPPVLPAPEPVQDGTLIVSSIEPPIGLASGGDRVTIRGRGFRGSMYVSFDNRPGTSLTVASSTMLMVTTPAHDPGLSAVTVSITGGPRVTLGRAFWFFGSWFGPTPYPVPAPPPTPSTTAPGSTPTTLPTGTSPTTTPGVTAPGPAPTTSPSTTTSTTAAPQLTSTTSTTQPPAVGQARFRFGASGPARGDLRLRPLLAPSPFGAWPPSTWSGRLCAAAACPGIKL